MNSPSVAFRLFPIFALLLSTSFSVLFGQDIQVKITPTIANNPLILGQSHLLNESKVEFQIDKFTCYISNLSLLWRGKVVTKLPLQNFLVDASQPKLLNLSVVSGKKYDAIQFDLGIDSLTNVSGALDGDLDPANGMYWTWQSGYINLKLEGAASNCPARNQKFQFHLGGYQGDQYAMQHITLPIKRSKVQSAEFELKIPLDDFLGQIDLSKTYQVMSPGPEAVMLAKQISESITIAQ